MLMLSEVFSTHWMGNSVSDLHWEGLDKRNLAYPYTLPSESFKMSDAPNLFTQHLSHVQELLCLCNLPIRHAIIGPDVPKSWSPFAEQ